MTQEEYNEQQEKRNRNLARVKASIQMIRESIAKTETKKGIDSVKRKEVIRDLEQAIEENYRTAESLYHATREEVDNATYGEASEEYVEKYEKYLKKRGLTHEQVANKALVMASAAPEDGKRKRVRKRKVEGVEAEIMKQMMAEATDEEIKKRSEETDNIVTKVINKPKHKTSKAEAVQKPVSDSSEITAQESSQQFAENKVKGGLENDYDFDFGSIDPKIQYDMIVLPSEGQCYAHKKARIPVAYLTAADENLIASPNMYRDGKIIDVILKRKILDPSIKVEELCKGDRDAIVLWLRATGYGPDFPIRVKNPNDTSKVYETSINLGTLKYKDFFLMGDENGLFSYKLSNGDILKFRFLTKDDENTLTQTLAATYLNVNKMNILKHMKEVKYHFESMGDHGSEFDEEELRLDIEELYDWANSVEEGDVDDVDFLEVVTERMILQTVEVNGNRDRDYIKEYIENMRAYDSYRYRNYMLQNEPGVNFKITIDIPESDGGGSFDTFLSIDDAIFLNI